MSRKWAQDRAFSVAEAAEVIGFKESTLRDWLASGAAPYASAKKGSERVLSCADIYVLSIAKWLVSAGYSILVATAEAWRIAGGPDADPQNVSLEHAIIADLGGGAMGTVHLIHEFDLPEHLPTRGAAFVPVGRIARNVVVQCLDLYGTRVSGQDIVQAVSAIADHAVELADRHRDSRGAA